MSLQFILGNSGSGKTTYMFKSIVKEAEANKDKNYLVIVPDQFTLSTQEMLVDLSTNGAIMNVDVLSFKRLAYRVFDDLGINNLNVLEETGKNLVLRKVAQEKEKELTVLRGNMNRIGYVSEVKSLLSEFMQYNIGPDKLKEYVEGGKLPKGLSDKLSDVQTIYEGFEAFMRDRYITDEEVLNVLISVVKDSELLKGSVLAFDEFTGFTPIQNMLLRELFPIVDKIMISLTIDSKVANEPRVSDQELFNLPKKTIEAVRKLAINAGVEELEPIILDASEDFRGGSSKELYFLEQSLFRKGQQSFEGENSDIRMFSANTQKEELIAVAREINRLVQQKGYRYKEIAVVSGAMEIYGNYAEAIMGEYNIPFFLDATTDILFHPFIEFIRSMIEVAHRDFSRESVIRFVRCGFCNIEDKDLDAFENYLIATGIRGRREWSRKWLRATRQRGIYDLDKINEIREYIYNCLLPITSVFENREASVGDRIRGIYEVIISLQVEQQLHAKSDAYLEQGQQVKAKSYEMIYKLVMSLFDKYVALLGKDIITVNEFIEILDAGLDAAKVPTLPPGYDCVTLGDIERTRLNGVKVLFFIGVNDGVVPKANNRGGIISQYERESLKALDIELAPGAREQAFIQRFYLYLNMTKPSDRLYVSYARIDTEGKANLESYLINVLKKLFPRMEVAAFEDIRTELNVSTQEAAMEYLVYGPRDEKWYALARWFMGEKEQGEMIENLLLAKYMHYVNNPISQQVARAIYGKNIKGSVTRLEKYSRCAYAHFLEYGLKLKPREESSFGDMDMGNIYHNALDRYSKKLEASEYDWFSVKEEDRNGMAEQAFEEVVAEYPNLTSYGNKESEHMLVRMNRIFKQTVWALTEQVRKGQYQPEGSELTFDINDGKNMELTGRIDRVDTYRSEENNSLYIKIIDYKSGSSKFDLLKLYKGLQLQLVVYMNAAFEKKARDNSVREIIPGGLFYYNIDDPVIELTGEASEEELKAEILKSLKPDGIINTTDQEAYMAMDMELSPGESSDVIPLAFKKGGDLKAGSSIMTRDEINLIGQYVDYKIRKIGEDIYQGNVSVNPMSGDNDDGCKFCEFAGICGIKSRLPGFCGSKYSKLKKEEILEAMETELALDKGSVADKEAKREEE